MGQRVVRVNELVKREVSDILHTRFQAEAVSITIMDVTVAPNLRNAHVYYSTVGGEEASRRAGRFFAREKREIRLLLGKRITLKYLPVLDFVEDNSNARGAHINAIMDDMGLVGEIDAPEVSSWDELSGDSDEETL